jgi:8-oxo-dGTP diphosphatase
MTDSTEHYLRKLSERKIVKAVTCFIVKDGNVLLQERPQGKLWGGILNGPGGKVELGESSERAVVREVQEETGLIVNAPQSRGTVVLNIPTPQTMILSVDIFVARNSSGQETEREGSLAWYPVSELPFQRMWGDQKYWLPAVLDGYSVFARVEYKESSLKLADLELSLKTGSG